MNTAIILDSNDPEICYQSKRKSRFIIATFMKHSAVLSKDENSVYKLKRNPIEITLYNFSAYTPKLPGEYKIIRKIVNCQKEKLTKLFRNIKKPQIKSIKNLNCQKN